MSDLLSSIAATVTAWAIIFPFYYFGGWKPPETVFGLFCWIAAYEVTSHIVEYFIAQRKAGAK